MSDCTETLQPSTSLADAIARAADGAVLCLQPGTYQVQQVVRRSITLRGLGAPGAVVLDAAGRGSALSLDRAAAHVVLEHLTITNGGSALGGALKTQAGDVVLRDVVLRGNHADGEGPGAALAAETGAVLLERCQLTGNRGRGVLYVGGNAKVTLRQTAIAGNRVIPPKSALVLVREWGQLALDHATVAANTGDLVFAVWPVAGSKPSVQVADSILDGAVLADPTGSKITATRTLLHGDAAGVTDGGGNRAGDPKLAGTGDVPWRPAADSPARGLARPGDGTDLAGARSGTTAGALE